MRLTKWKLPSGTWIVVFSLLSAAILGLVILSLSCNSSTKTPADSSIIYVPDSRAVTLVDPNDPNTYPAGWICVSPGAYQSLIRAQGWAFERGYGMAGE
jgi:hypothetical protein